MQKMVCTAIRPTKLPFPELECWQDCARFVGDHLHYEPLVSPILIPNRLYSPHSTILRQLGHCFELATVLCSLLIGLGYDAYVVSGYANKDITMKIMNRVDSPYPADVQKEQEQIEQKTDAKYKIKETKDLRSKFLLMMDQREVYKIQAENDRIEEELRQKILNEEMLPPDDLENSRIHGWVLLLAGEHDVASSTFIEPSTGIIHSLDTLSFLGVESIWNHLNYWVNMQDNIEFKNLDYDLTNVSNWEHLLIGEPMKLRKYKKRESVDVEENTRDMYDEKHLDMPMSWSLKIEIPYEVVENRYPNGIKQTNYKRAYIEEFAPYLQVDGLTLRITRYADFECTNIDVIEEHFSHREDKLKNIVMDAKSEVTIEHYDRGREDCVKKHTFRDGNLNDDRTIEFYGEARYDCLEKIELQKFVMYLYYINRDDKLFLQIVYYSISKLAPKLKSDKFITKVVQQFNRNEKVPASQDIALRKFGISDREIFLKFHYGKGKVTASTRHFQKPPVSDIDEGMQFHPDLTSGYDAEMSDKPPRQLQLLILFEKQLVDETNMLKGIKDIEEQITEFLLLRDKETAFPKLVVSIFNREHNVEYKMGMLEKEAETRKKKEKEVEVDTDFLAPYIERLSTVAHLKSRFNAADAIELKSCCLNEFKKLLVDRANMILLQFDQTSQLILSKQKWYSQNSEILSPQNDVEYLQDLNNLNFVLHALEMRLVRHRDLSHTRYQAISNYLNNHPKLAIIKDQKL